MPGALPWPTAGVQQRQGSELPACAGRLDTCYSTSPVWLDGARQTEPLKIPAFDAIRPRIVLNLRIPVSDGRAFPQSSEQSSARKLPLQSGIPHTFTGMLCVIV